MKKGIRRILAGVLAGIMVFSSGVQMISAGDVTGAQLFSDGADVVIDELEQNSIPGTAPVTPVEEDSGGEVELFSDTLEADAAQTEDVSSDTGAGLQEDGAAIQFTDAQDVGEGGTDPAEDPISGTSENTPSESNAEVSPTPSPQQDNIQGFTGAEELEDISDGGQFTDNEQDPSPSDNQAQQVTNWSGSKNFLFSLTGVEETPEETWQISLEFVFSEISVENPVKTGDMVTLSLPVQWMNISDSGTNADIYPVIRRNDENGGITEEKLNTKIAEYRILNGVLEIRFTEGIEAEEIVQQLSQLYGQLEIPFVWKDDTRTEVNQEAVWTLQTYEDGTTNEVKLVIPAVQQDDAEPLEEGQNEAGEAGGTETDDSELSEEAGDEKEIDIEMADTEEELPEESDVYIEEEEEQAAGTGELQPETAAFSLFSAGVSTLANDISLGQYTLVNDNTLKYNNNSQDRDIYWIDNNNGQGKRPEKENVKKYFTDNQTVLSVNGIFTYNDGTNTKTISLENIPYTAVSTSSSSVELTDLGGTGHWSLRVSNLLSDGKLIIDGKTYTGTFSDWELSYADPSALDEVASNDSYAAVLVTEVEDDGTPIDQNGRERVSATGKLGWYFVEETDYVANISIRCGTTEFDTDLIKKAIESNYSFTWKTGLQDADGHDLNEGSYPLTSREWLTFSWDTSGVNKGELLSGIATVTGLERFNLDGSELFFNIDGTNGGDPVKITDIRDEGGNNILTDGDYLAESIENDAVSNWGTNVDQVYSGGTLILTLTGTTEYIATKEWRDKDRDTDTVRPQADFYLWRFTKTSEDNEYLKAAYQTASPVKDSSGQTAQFTIQENSTEDSQVIDFSGKFADSAGNKTDYLPKYDQEGFEYVYITREYMSGKDVGKYKTVYGKVSDTDVDKITDTLIYSGERPAIDNSVYNTGTVSNMLSGSTAAGVTKTWEAAYFQSELTDVTVELTLQKSVDNGKTWSDTSEIYTMGKDYPFYAEFLSQSHSVSMPKYDNYGRLLQYRWVESAVYQGQDSTTNLLQNTDPLTFVLNQKSQAVEYTSTATVEPDGNGNYHTDIVNKIKDETEYYVKKEWGEGIEPESVDLIIYRTNALNEQQKLLPENKSDGRFTINGEEDDSPIALYYNGEIVGQVQEVSPWVVAYTKLQKYDTDGSGFDYVVLEGSNNKYQAQYSSGEIILPDGTVVEDGLIITNIGPGTGTELNLRKRWLDEGDEQHRGTVTFTVYKIKDLTSAEADTRFADTNLEKIGDYTIDRSTNWWRKVWIEGKIDSKNLLVLETAIASTDNDGKYVEIPYTPQDMAEIYAIQQTDPAATEPNSYYTYETKYHKYEAFYSMVNLEGVRFYTVTNRRLGTVDIDVTKYWRDGSSGTEMSAKRKELQEALNNKGYDLVLYLECSSEDVEIDYVNGTVTFGHEKLTVQDQTGKATGAIQRISLEGVEGGLNINEALYQFYNLPKYDMNGRLITYTVTEMAIPKNSSGAEGITTVQDALREAYGSLEYSFSDGTTSYQPSHDSHVNDKQEVSVTNALSGTKEVVFWKEWNDAYRYKRNERPDIYLELYRLHHETGESGTAEEKLENLYLDRTWTFTSEEISYCEFGNLNKYDSLGYEIIYYAKESCNVDKDQFNYKKVYYKYDPDLTPNKTEAGEAESTIEQIENAEIIGDESGFFSSSPEDATLLRENEENIYLLKENGIFVNELSAAVTFNGKKIWANIPTGFLDEDLPPVTFDLYQFTEGVDDPIPSDEDGQEVYEKYSDHKIASLTINSWDDHKIKSEYLFVIEYEGTNINAKSADGNSIQCISGETDSSKQNIPIDKYDSNGNLHVYRFRESAELLENTEIGAVFNQPTINNYAIRNPYESDLGYITVKKILDLSEYEDNLNEYPVVNFRLTREYTNSNQQKVSDTVFQRLEFIDFNKGDHEEQTITFEDLSIYAPNGSKYIYTVEELGQEDGGLIHGGFAVYASKGDQEAEYEFGTENKKVTDLYPVLNPLPEDPSEEKIAATFKNEYEKEYAPLRFTKRWNDAGQSNLRFATPLTFKINYQADSQPGMNNAITSRTGGSFTIALDATDKNLQTVKLTQDNGKLEVNPSVNKEDPVNTIKTVRISVPEKQTLGSYADWTIEVTEFLIYAPTGMPWKYTLTEQEVYPYIPNENRRTFNFDTAKKMFTCGSNVYKNTLQISMSATKNVRSMDEPTVDYDANNKGIWNYTGYDISLEYEVYAKFVKATTWKDAEQQFLNEETAGEGWISLADYHESQRNDNPAANALLTAMGSSTSKLHLTNSFNNDTSFGKKTVTCDKLLRSVDVGEDTYFVSYLFAETGLTMKEQDGTEVYRQTFTPNFFLTTVPDGLTNGIDKAVYNAGDSVVAYYFTTTAEYLANVSTMTYQSTTYHFMNPAYESEADVKNKVEGNKSSFLHEEWLPYVWVNGYRDNRTTQTTFINDEFNYIKLVDLDVTKIWEKDNGNIYGTRPEEGKQWLVDYQIEQSLDNGKTWTAFNAGSQYLSITGNAADDTRTVSYKNLPANGIIKKADGTGYEVAEEYKYRIREKDPANSDTVTETWFNEAYKVTYNDSEQADEATGKNDKWTLTATNTLQIIDVYAEKKWENSALTSPVTLELQYQSGTDDEENPIWESFDTPSKVTLDGSGNDPDVYYEYDSWKAKWTGVPQIMPGSVTTGEGDIKQTIYRVVEVTENAYGSDNDGKVLTGTGTQSEPYVLVGTGTEADPFAITNELTQIKVQKTVQKPDRAELKNPNEEFTFTVTTGAIPSGAKYAVSDDVGKVNPDSAETFSGTFKLKDGQYAIIYGLKKGETYTVTETGSGYQVSYKLNGQEQNTGEIEVPVSKPQTSDTIPTLEVINEKFSKVTVEKKDAQGNNFEGATFRLERKDDTNDTWSQVGNDITTGTEGKAEFNNLVFGTYRITETATKPGYNKMVKPIEFTLPLENETDQGDYYYSIPENGTTSYYYTDITLKVENDQAFAMPETSGTGFFWPGIAGMAAIIGVSGYYVIYNKKKRRRRITSN